MSPNGKKRVCRGPVSNPGEIRPNIIFIRRKVMFGPVGCVGARMDERLRTQEAEGREREERRWMSPTGEKGGGRDQVPNPGGIRPNNLFVRTKLMFGDWQAA